MKAVVYKEYGSPSVLRYTDVPQPVAGARETLVRVHAAALNHGDKVALRGIPRLGRLAFGIGKPKKQILGRAVAGTVVDTGAPVFGEANQCGFAEYVAVPPGFAAIPEGVTFEQAATLPVAGITALQAVRLGSVRPGTKVLVNGASGGVGTFAVQLARLRGGTVTAVCSTRNIDLVRSLGAAAVVDYTQADFTQGTDRYDVIIDLVGNHPLAAVRRALTPSGVYVASHDHGGPVLGPIPLLFSLLARAPFARQKLRNLLAKANPDDLAELAALVATGELTPVIERTVPMSETADAMRLMEKNHARGKTVLLAPAA